MVVRQTLAYLSHRLLGALRFPVRSKIEYQFGGYSGLESPLDSGLLS
jgi:hypothetical protein